MKQPLICLAALLLTPGIALAQTPVAAPAILAGHAVQPAKTFVSAPQDAPASLTLER